VFVGIMYFNLEYADVTTSFDWMKMSNGPFWMERVLISKFHL